MPAIQFRSPGQAFVAAANNVLTERQSNDDDFKVIPATYGSLYTSLEPGVVAGIVLGSVAAFLLLLFICYSALGFGPPIFSKWTTEGSVVEVRARRTSRASHSSRRTSRHTRSPKRRRPPSIVSGDSYEVRTYERVHVVPPPPRRGGGGGEPIIVDAAPSSLHTLSDSDSEEDEVVVIEESSTPPRRRRDRSYDRRRSPSY